MTRPLFRAGVVAVCSLGAAFFLSAESGATQIQYAKVIEVIGKAEVRAPHTVTWKPLMGETDLKTGTKIRTLEKSLVRMKLDWKMEGILELAENSVLTVWGHPPSQLMLEQGKLFIMREMDVNIGSFMTGAVEPLLSVTTKDLTARMGSAGLELSVTPDGSWIKTFGSELDIQVSSKAGGQLRSPREGFKLFVSQKYGRADLKRMDFQDYAPWLAWVKVVYAKKNGLFYDYFDKNYLR